MPDQDDEYKVGYRKPPKHTQFRPGHSGNPRGRPKAQTNPKTLFKEIAEQRVPVRMGGKTKTMTFVEAIFNSLLSKALAGNPAAIRAFLKLIEVNGYFENGPPEGYYGVMVVPEQETDPEKWSQETQKQQAEAASRAKEIHAEVRRELETENEEKRPRPASQKKQEPQPEERTPGSKEPKCEANPVKPRKVRIVKMKP